MSSYGGKSWGVIYPDYATFDLELENENKEFRRIFMNPIYYSSLQLLLDDLFVNYLSEVVHPYSYGDEWVLSIPFYCIIAPLEWIGAPNTSVHKLSPLWAKSKSPSQQRIIPGSNWEIIVRKTEPIVNSDLYGVVSNNEELMDELLSRPKAIGHFYPSYFNNYSLQEFNKSQYKFECVFIDWLMLRLNGKILEDKGEPIYQK